MNKIAQRRGPLNKLREWAGKPGEAVSGAFSPEFTRLMDSLRETDDDAREHAAELKDMLKVARSNFNRREYMTTISYLGKFHERVELVRMTFLKLIKEVDGIHNQFLFDDLDEEHRKYLFEHMPEKYKPKPKIKPSEKAKADDGLSKGAGVGDWLNSSLLFGTPRGKSLKSWEKRFPKAAKEIKRSTEKMLSRSEMFLNLLQSTFKTLATLRASRKLEEYIKISNGFIVKYNSYDDAFNEYFNASVRRFIDSQKEFEQNKKEKEVELETLRKRPVEEADLTSGDRPNGNFPAYKAPEGESSPDSSDRPTGEHKKHEGPASESGGGNAAPTGEQTLEDVKKDLENMMGNPPAQPFPEREAVVEPAVESVHDTTRDPEREFEPEPSTPRPPSGEKVRALIPYKHTPLGLVEKGLIPSQAPANSFHKSVIVTDPEAAPLSPTMMSPGQMRPPPGSQAVVPHIPPSRVPQVSNTGPTPSEAARFHYYKEPPVAPPPVATFRPPVHQKPRLELVDIATTPESKSTASEFIDKITKLSSENPLVMALEIIKFAKSIEVSDQATSKRLLQVANKLINQ